MCGLRLFHKQGGYSPQAPASYASDMCEIGVHFIVILECIGYLIQHVISIIRDYIRCITYSMKDSVLYVEGHVCYLQNESADSIVIYTPP